MLSQLEPFRGCAFATFERRADAARALEYLDKSNLNGRLITVRTAMCLIRLHQMREMQPIVNSDCSVCLSSPQPPQPHLITGDGLE